MTTPANMTLNDILTRCANWLRIPTSNTTETAKIQYMINSVYRDLSAKQDWWWLLKRSVINTAPKVAITSATVTNDSTAASSLVVASGSTLANSLAGYVLLAPGNAQDPSAVYRVSTHTAAATSLTLDAAFTGESSTTAALNIYKDAYALPADCGKLLQVKAYGRDLLPRRDGIESLGNLRVNSTRTGRPEVYSLFDFATTGDPTTQRLLQVYPSPDVTYRLELYYKQNLNTELSTTTRPFIPDDFVQVLEYGTLARAFPIVLNDLDRGKYYQSLFNDVLALMAAQQREYASDHAQMAPDDTYRSGRRSRRRTGAYTLGSLFDRYPAEW